MQTGIIYNHGWSYRAKDCIQFARMTKMRMAQSTYALAGGMYVRASSWQDAPTAPPSISICG